MWKPRLLYWIPVLYHYRSCDVLWVSGYKHCWLKKCKNTISMTYKKQLTQTVYITTCYSKLGTLFCMRQDKLSIQETGITNFQYLWRIA